MLLQILTHLGQKYALRSSQQTRFFMEPVLCTLDFWHILPLILLLFNWGWKHIRFSFLFLGFIGGGSSEVSCVWNALSLESRLHAGNFCIPNLEDWASTTRFSFIWGFALIFLGCNHCEFESEALKLGSFDLVSPIMFSSSFVSWFLWCWNFNGNGIMERVSP